MSKQYKEELINSLLKIKTEQEMEAFLRSILTPHELEEVPKRLAIFEMLKKGVPQHEIASKVNVGVATVTRGSIELQRGQIQKTGWWQSLSSHLGG
jgi:TrpR family trp operon transcriptional repressor